MVIDLAQSVMITLCIRFSTAGTGWLLFSGRHNRASRWIVAFRTLPINWKHQHEVAQAGANAILRATGQKYRCGSASSILNFAVGGSSIDYAHDIEKIPFALVMEIASKGFHPPKANISRICDETWIGIQAMVMQMAISPKVSFTRSKTTL
ncbi:AAEL000072-PA [Aedes aegypti]|uniref:AAEL000072-PA n=1 Tax=Aedes aegypti TaxID=7159 RepID=Q0C7B8_AEDAE|nr:AAEL000072-PA [Aedes aegypti]